VGRGKVGRYRWLLLAKRREVLNARVGTGGPFPAARIEPGDVVDQAATDSEAKVQVRLRETESHLLRAIDEALVRFARGTFGVCLACGRPFPERGSRPCPGRGSAGIVKNKGQLESRRDG
jgi:DnaK suppressor protein